MSLDIELIVCQIWSHFTGFTWQNDRSRNKKWLYKVTQSNSKISMFLTWSCNVSQALTYSVWKLDISTRFKQYQSDNKHQVSPELGNRNVKRRQSLYFQPDLVKISVIIFHGCSVVIHNLRTNFIQRIQYNQFQTFLWMQTVQRLRQWLRTCPRVLK